MKIDKQIIKYIINEKRKYGNAQFVSHDIAKKLKIPEDVVESRVEYLVKNKYADGILAHEYIFSPFEDSIPIHINESSVITGITPLGETLLVPVFYRKSFWATVSSILGFIITILTIKSLL